MVTKPPFPDPAGGPGPPYPRCPVCGGFIPSAAHAGQYPGALSRRDNVTEICSDCGFLEALEDWAHQARAWQRLA